ncbi:MAG: amino acid ABC transporter substrate-binding protein [Candidatus Dadabacteria bacterium]|nr:MAG: amino acid ABC transporter substrate-binding protein [Candidatus Dadabacteria bacterium]
MNSRRRFAAALFILAVFAPIQLPAAPIERPLIRLTNGEWPPWMSERLPEGGPVSQLVREAWAEAGFAVKWGWMPWARGYALAAAGAWDGTTGWSRTPARERAFVYSAPLFEGETVLLSRRDKPVTWRTVDDLRGVRLGVTLSYTYGTTIDSMIASGALLTDPAPDDTTNLQKLLAGRIDAFPLERHVAGALLQQAFPRQAHLIGCSPTLLRRATYHLLLTRKRPDAQALAEQFNAGLARLIERGRAAAILDVVKRSALRCDFR